MPCGSGWKVLGSSKESLVSTPDSPARGGSRFLVARTQIMVTLYPPRRVPSTHFDSAFRFCCLDWVCDMNQGFAMASRFSRGILGRVCCAPYIKLRGNTTGAKTAGPHPCPSPAGRGADPPTWVIPHKVLSLSPRERGRGEGQSKNHSKTRFCLKTPVYVAHPEPGRREKALCLLAWDDIPVLRVGERESPL